MDWLILGTLVCVIWGLWVRRRTWRCRWEAAASLNLALQGCAAALMSPAASTAFGSPLHALTGVWNLEDCLAHLCFAVAASAALYHALERLVDKPMLRWKFRLFVEQPGTVCIAVLIAAFTMSNGARVYRPDFFDVPTDRWLEFYWLALCSVLLYLLGYGVRVLLALRKDPESRATATAYLVAASCGITACLIGIATTLVPPLRGREDGSGMSVFLLLCTVGFALTSAHSWRRKTNPAPRLTPR
jgi:hypothetical protein